VKDQYIYEARVDFKEAPDKSRRAQWDGSAEDAATSVSDCQSPFATERGQDEMSESSGSNSPEGEFDPHAFLRALQRQNAEALKTRLLQYVQRLLERGELSKWRISEIQFSSTMTTRPNIKSRANQRGLTPM
jgi:hypothetical protein